MKAGFNELVGVDPNEFRKAVSIYKETERQMFEIDKKISAEQKLGQYPNLEKATIARDKKRKSAMEALTKSYGVDENNPYISKGMVRNNEASLKALATNQALSTEIQLAAKGVNNLQADINLLIQNKVGNISLYQNKFNEAVKRGDIRGVDAQQRVIKDIYDNFAKSGNTHMAMAWLEQPQAAYDGKSLADVLPSSVITDSIGKAEQIMWDQGPRVSIRI